MGNETDVAAVALFLIDSSYALSVRRRSITDARSRSRYEPANSEFNEGAVRELAAELRVRDPRLKVAAIEQYGLSCMVCGFTFGDVYGSLGEGYIELHHLKCLSEGKRSSKVDDVAVVCANCHRMLHRKGASPIMIEKLKRLIAEARGS
jgi:5-methylcytosine-specific restriction protein A